MTDAISKKQNYNVVKSNDMIRYSRYALSVQEQKFIIYLISQIQENDSETKAYEFTIKEMFEIFGIQNCNKNYSDFKDIIKHLSDNSFWVKTPGHEKLCRWIKDVDIYDAENGGKTVSLKIDATLRPYLVGLKESFTKYELSAILAMESKYSVRMYEWLKSYAYYGNCEITVEQLKMYLQTDKYKEYKAFNANVIKKSVDEINKYTDINVAYEPIREGRSIASLRFTINKKSSRDYITTRSERSAKING